MTNPPLPTTASSPSSQIRLPGIAQRQVDILLQAEHAPAVQRDGE